MFRLFHPSESTHFLSETPKSKLQQLVEYSTTIIHYLTVFSDALCFLFFFKLMDTNKTSLLGVVKQLNKKTVDLCLQYVSHCLLLRVWHVWYTFMYILVYSVNVIPWLFHDHFSIFGRIKLWLGDTAFEMQFIFHVWGSWIRHWGIQLLSASDLFS